MKPFQWPTERQTRRNGCTRTSHDLLKKEVDWPDLSLRGTFQQSTFLHKVIHNKFPAYLHESLPLMQDHSNRAERKYKFNTPQYDHAFYIDSVIPSSISKWNNLLNYIRSIKKLDAFKYMLKNKYVESPKPLCHYGNCFNQLSHTHIRLKFSRVSRKRNFLTDQSVQLTNQTPIPPQYPCKI